MESAPSLAADSDGEHMSKTPPLKRCFLITPIGSAGSSERKRADWIYRFVEEVCDRAGFKAERADTMPGSPMITSRIFGAVTEADICVADLSDLNANVFYELGVRHSVRKPVIHIAEVGTTLPFDNAQHDAIFYDLSDVGSTDQLKKQLESSIKSMTADGYAVSNPLTAALGALEIGRSSDPKDKLIAQLSERIERLETTTYRRGTVSSRGPIDRDEATRILDNFAEATKNTKATAWQFSELVFSRAVNALDPWDDDVAEKAYDATYQSRALNNGAQLREILYERFPDLKSRVPGIDL